MKRFFFLGLSVLAVLGVFAAGFYAIAFYFEKHLVPYPHEVFGVLVGLGLACFTIVLLVVLRWIFSRIF